MAEFTHTCHFGTAYLSFTYDDSTMKLIGVSADNSMPGTMTITITSPISWTRTIKQGQSISVNLPAVSRPSYTVESINHHDSGVYVNIIRGVSWFANIRLGAN